MKQWVKHPGVRVTLHLIQPLANMPGEGSGGFFRHLGPCYPHKNLRQNFWLLALAWLRLSYNASVVHFIWEEKQQMEGRYSLTHTYSLPNHHSLFLSLK